MLGLMADAVSNVVQRIQPVSEAAKLKAFERLDSLAKPRRSLGFLEELAACYAAIRMNNRPVIGAKRVVVMAGDHGVVKEGVSAYPSSVTKLMLRNFIDGGAAINVLARRAGASLEVIDVGVASDPGDMPGLLRKNAQRGACNIAKGPAMTHEVAQAAISVGIEAAKRAAALGVTVLGTGEMGIGNTTPAAALFAALLNMPASEFTGPGTGLDADGIRRKTEVIERALAINKNCLTSPFETLAALGGLEIAALAGLCLGGAAQRMAVVVDGFISSAAALVAMRLQPASRGYLFFAHRSAEPGHKKFFTAEGLRPMVELDMRLGEGTGAAIAMQILEDAVAIFNEMATFEEAGITPGA